MVNRIAINIAAAITTLFLVVGGVLLVTSGEPVVMGLGFFAATVGVFYGYASFARPTNNNR